MKLEDIVDKTWNTFLEHPRIGGIGTFFVLDKFYQLFFNKETLNERVRSSLDLISTYYSTFQYSLQNDMLNKYFEVIKSSIVKDLFELTYIPIVYYLAVKWNRILSPLHTENFTPFIQGEKAYYRYRFGHQDKKILKKDLIELLKIKETKMILFALGKIEFDERNIEKALDYYRRGINLNKGKHLWELIDPVFNKRNLILKPAEILNAKVFGYGIDLSKILRYIKENPDDIGYHLNKSTHFYRQEAAAKLKRIIEVSTGVNKKSLEVRFVYALMMDDLNDRAFSSRLWIDGLKMLMKNGASFSRIAETRNEVLEFGGKEFFRKLFVFKRSSLREALFRDYFVNNVFYSESKNVPEPLYFLRHEEENKYYSITKREDKLDLERLVANGGNIQGHVNEAIKNIGILHTIGLNHLDGNKLCIERDGIKIDLPRYDYLNEFELRLLNRLGKGTKLDRLHRLYSQHIGKFESMGFLCHGDLFLSNVLEGGMIIDFDRATIANPSLDLGTLIESSGEHNHDETKRLIDIYFNNLSALENGNLRENVTRNYFQLDRVHILMCEVGSRFKRNKIDQARKYVRRIQGYLDEQNIELKDAFVDYIYGVQPALLS